MGGVTGGNAPSRTKGERRHLDVRGKKSRLFEPAALNVGLSENILREATWVGSTTNVGSELAPPRQQGNKRETKKKKKDKEGRREKRKKKSTRPGHCGGGNRFRKRKKKQRKQQRTKQYSLSPHRRVARTHVTRRPLPRRRRRPMHHPRRRRPLPAERVRQGWRGNSRRHHRHGRH